MLRALVVILLVGLSACQAASEWYLIANSESMRRELAPR